MSSAASPQPAGPTPPPAEDLSSHVQALEARVAALEEYLHIQPRAAVADAVPETAAAEASSFGEALPVTGRFLLGIAGGYVLRALTETQTISHALGVATGFLYAAAWLYVAVRTAPTRRLAALASSLTSILILGPLLFEASQHFQAISGTTAAAVLAAFALTAVVLCWNRPGSAVPVIVTAGSATFALILLVALRDLLPFTLALLVIAAGVEFAACFDRETSSRPFLALAVDVALVICAIIAGLPGGLPAGYVAVGLPALAAAQIALLVIYLASTAARTIVQQRKFTNFETIQTALAFIIGLGGALYITNASGIGIAAIGIFACLGGVGCYVISFVFVGREGKRDRNFLTYATFALVLTLAGSYLLFSGVALVLVWAYVLVCCWTGLRAERHILELHAATALLLAPFVSGVAAQPQRQFFGDPLAPIALLPELIIAVAALLACLAVQRPQSWDDRIAAFAFSLTLTWCASGLLAHGLTELAPAAAATWNTLVLVSLSAGLAFAAARRNRTELRILVVLFTVLGAAKLLAVDIHQPHMFGLAVSLLLYGGTLIVLPRLLSTR